MSINDARIHAKEAWLDLMQMSFKNGFAVVKMLDYWKFLYRQKKLDRKNKAGGKSPDLKTLRITFKISDHDMDVKRNQAEKFAKIGHPIKVVLMLRWRENHYSDIAFEKMQIFVEKVQDFYKLDAKISKAGNTLSAMLKVIK